MEIGDNLAIALIIIVLILSISIGTCNKPDKEQKIIIIEKDSLGQMDTIRIEIIK